MKVLVTGGAGYIGSHVVHDLISENHDVIILDDLSTGNIEAVHPEAKFINGSQLDEKTLDNVFLENNIDIVIHLSAKLIVSESVKFPEMYFTNNVGGITKIIQAMKKHDVKNIVFSSTGSIYGQIDKDKISETDPSSPMNPYAESKLECENLIINSGLNYTIFRYFNVAGAHSNGKIGLSTKGMPVSHIIPIAVEVVLGLREKFTIFGNDYNTHDGTCIRDYIHVMDLSKAHIAGMMNAVEGKSGLYNLGSGKGFSNKEIIDTIESLDLTIPHEYGPRRGGDPDKLIASCEKAINELDFTIKYDLKDMILSDKKWRENKKY